MSQIFEFDLQHHNNLIFELPEHNKIYYKHLLLQKSEALGISKFFLILQYIIILCLLVNLVFININFIPALLSGVSVGFGSLVITNIYRYNKYNKLLRELIKDITPWWRLEEFGGYV